MGFRKWAWAWAPGGLKRAGCSSRCVPGGDEHRDELAAGWRHEVRCVVRADDSE